jgi:hypothetical protein
MLSTEISSLFEMSAGLLPVGRWIEKAQREAVVQHR